MIIFICLAIVFISATWCIIVRKSMQYWIFSYVIDVLARRNGLCQNGVVEIMFSVVDHFEPGNRNNIPCIADKRVEKWVEEYPQLAISHRDADGFPPKFTWFFPPHEDKRHLKKLIDICKRGFGEIELHMHHDHILPMPENSTTLEKKILNAIEEYSKLGIFGKDRTNGKTRYGFIHGDWALDNSRGGRFCGVNNELEVLSRTGCYADFTFPSICESQPAKINSIYYAKDDPMKPKSYNNGVDVEVGGKSSGDLMIVEGPIGLRWKTKRGFPFPSIEAAGISADNLPTRGRVDFWVRKAISVKKKPDWIFIKIHTHGAPEENAKVLLGEEMDKMYSYLEKKYNDGKKFRLHYVTTREMYNIIKAAEEGKTGDPMKFRDYVVDKPFGQGEKCPV